MKITYDPNKKTRNIEVRGTSFERVREFDFQTAQLKAALHVSQYNSSAVPSLSHTQDGDTFW